MKEHGPRRDVSREAKQILIQCMLGSMFSRHTYGIDWACQLQGLGLNIVELCVIMWNAFMAYNLHAWLVNKADVSRLQKRLNRVLFR